MLYLSQLFCSTSIMIQCQLILGGGGGTMMMMMTTYMPLFNKVVTSQHQIKWFSVPNKLKIGGGGADHSNSHWAMSSLCNGCQLPCCRVLLSSSEHFSMFSHPGKERDKESTAFYHQKDKKDQILHGKGGERKLYWHLLLLQRLKALPCASVQKQRSTSPLKKFGIRNLDWLGKRSEWEPPRLCKDSMRWKQSSPCWSSHCIIPVEAPRNAGPWKDIWASRSHSEMRRKLGDSSLWSPVL